MRSSKRNKKGGRTLRHAVIFIGIIGVLAASYFAFGLYKEVYRSNVSLTDSKSTHVYIPTGSSFDEVMAIFKSDGYLKDYDSFYRYANSRGYYKKIRPGRYKITNGMSNHQLLDMLQSGIQDIVRLSINNVRTKERLASIISRHLEPDSMALIDYLNDDSVSSSLGMTPENVISLFIPNTYDFYWNVSASDIVKRMKKEYDSFWSKKNRQQKADSLGLTREEVMTVASIVDEETNYVPEMPTIASVYLNRLHIGMMLQADPTVKFALGDFSIRRVLNRHLVFDSPYNTYRYKGLPPGPIAIPSIDAIDAVLNPDQTSYIFFCAKADFSGSHAFAKNQSEHLKNARDYQNALNARNIKK